MLEGVVFLNRRLKHTFVEAYHDIQRTTIVEGFCVVDDDLAVLEAQFASKAESPDTTVLLGKQRRVLCFNAETGYIRLGRYILIQEHVTDGICIGIGVDKTRDDITRRVGTTATLAKSPAEFIAVVLVDDTAFACLPVATAIYVPATDIGKLEAVLVAHLQVTNLAASHIAQSDIALRTFRVDVHHSGLRDMGITITAQHHADVERMEKRTS